jgi:hypothetical protein
MEAAFGELVDPCNREGIGRRRRRKYRAARVEVQADSERSPRTSLRRIFRLRRLDMGRFTHPENEPVTEPSHQREPHDDCGDLRRGVELLEFVEHEVEYRAARRTGQAESGEHHERHVGFIRDVEQKPSGYENHRANV